MLTLSPVLARQTLHFVKYCTQVMRYFKKGPEGAAMSYLSTKVIWTYFQSVNE